MSSTPVISVLLPVYNAEKYIEQAVTSVLNQTFTDFELIVINDASTDNTLPILNGFSDNRIKIITNPESYRISKSLNIGIRLAKGEYIARMDGDDIAHPKRFEKQIALFFAKPDVSFCCTWVRQFKDNVSKKYIKRNYPNHDEIKANLLFLNTIFHPTVMFKKEALKKYNLSYDESLRLLEDYTLWVNASEKVRFANINEALLDYRIHTTNISVLKGENRNKLDEGHYRVYQHIFNKLELKYSERDLAVHRKIAIREIDYGDATLTAEIVEWLERIVKANRKKHYYEERALSQVLLSCLVYMLIKSKFSINTSTVIFKSIYRIFKLSHVFSFTKERAWRHIKAIGIQ